MDSVIDLRMHMDRSPYTVNEVRVKHDSRSMLQGLLCVRNVETDTSRPAVQFLDPQGFTAV